MEMRCYRKILRISYKDHVTNEEVHAKIQQAIGPHKDLLTIMHCKETQTAVVWSCLPFSLEFAKSQRAVENGKMEETGCEIICGAPTTLAVKG